MQGVPRSGVPSTVLCPGFLGTVNCTAEGGA